jgi:protein-S-isoprenylcysteine O-methyltransferase Ste14
VSLSFHRPHIPAISRRRFGDFLLFGFTLAELALLFYLTSTLTIADWIYVSEHLLILGIALMRPVARFQDSSFVSSTAVVVAYAYPYAQVLYLQWAPSNPVWPAGGLALVTLAACLGLASLLAFGRLFGIWPALRGLATKGPYRVVRHPMYLAYMLADIGYNLYQSNFGTAMLVIVGWVSLFYRIRAEERILARDAGWANYASSVRYRLVPGIW